MFFALPLLAGLAAAYDPDQPEVQVLTVEHGAIKVDGQLGEGPWSTAIPITDLLRHRPTRGGPPPCPTEIRFLQDDKNLYVGARVFDCDYKVRARVAAREQINEDDQIGVYFDPIGDGRSGYHFYINPVGIQQDIRNSNGEWSFSWNTAFTTRGHVTDDGYEIEMAFPWRSLKYPSGEDEQTWGVIVTRVIPHEGSKYSFPQVVDGHPRVMTLAAPLVGVRPPRRGSGLELIPGLTAGQAWPREDGSTTGLDPWQQVLRPSLDLRYGITPDISLTAALNPDFSQVEADVPDVRVNPRFAFQFPETRAFFLDGFDYFEDRANTLYTRSINAPIHGIKLSGREGPVAMGVLHTLDRSPLPTFNSAGTPGFGEARTTDALAMTDAVRLRHDAFDDGFVGVTYADKRLFNGDGTGFIDGASLFHAAAVDFEAPLDDEYWWLGGSSQHTVVRGPQTDWTWGMRNELALSRTDRLGTSGNLWARDITPGHRLETGFSPLSGVTSTGASLDHVFTVDKWVDTVTPGADASVTLERDRDRRIEAGPDLDMRVGDVHQLSVGGNWVDQVEGGVEVVGWNADAGYEANPASWLTVAPEAEVGRGFDYANGTAADELLVTWKSSLIPTAWLRLDTQASYGRLASEARRVPVAEAALVRNKLNLQFHRELGLRIIEAWTDESEEPPGLASSVLLTWFRVPGTAAYLGYSERTDLDRLEMVERSVFAKASILFRP